MTEFVKKFIESNIDAIEERDWTEVVSLWYGEVVSDFTYNDDYFNEFSQIMSTAGIDFMEESLPARKSFMESILSQYLEGAVDSARYRGIREIDKNEVFMMVDSDLGFIREELEVILDDLAEEVYHLGVDFTCYYVE